MVNYSHTLRDLTLLGICQPLIEGKKKFGPINNLGISPFSMDGGSGGGSSTKRRTMGGGKSDLHPSTSVMSEDGSICEPFTFTNGNKTHHAKYLETRRESRATGRKKGVDGSGEPFNFTYFSSACKCAAYKFGGTCGGECAVHVYDVDGEEEALCLICAHELMGEKQAKKSLPDRTIAPVTNVVESGVETTFNATLPDKKVVQQRCNGGAPNVAKEGIFIGSLSITSLAKELGNVEDLSAFMEDLAKNKKFWNAVVEGVGRNSSYLNTSKFESHENPGSSGRQDFWGPTRDDLEKHQPFKKFFKDVEARHKCEIKHGHMTCILSYLISKKLKVTGKMRPHGDKDYRGKPLKRGVLTVGDTKTGTKTLRIIDMKYGRWVDIPCPHGTFIEFDYIFSGTSCPRYVHGVRNAEGTYSLVLDYGRLG